MWPGELDLVCSLLSLGAHADARRGGVGTGEGDGTSALHWVCYGTQREVRRRAGEGGGDVTFAVELSSAPLILY